MKLYLSGKITGDANYKEKFAKAELALRDAGFDVFNPAAALLNDEADWLDYLRRDVKALMDCDAVALLPDWQLSKGATIEAGLAAMLKMQVAP